MSIRRWVSLPLDKDAAAQLSEDCGAHPFLALLLNTRGITSAEDAAEFLYGTELNEDPFSLADMDLAVERVQRAIDGGERIAVFGDYDADGVTATVLPVQLSVLARGGCVLPAAGTRGGRLRASPADHRPARRRGSQTHYHGGQRHRGGG